MLCLSCLTLRSLGSLISSTGPLAREDVVTAMTVVLGGLATVDGVCKQTVAIVQRTLAGATLQGVGMTAAMAVVAVADNVLQDQMSSLTAKWANA